MLDPELAARLDAIEAKAEAAALSARKAQQYLFWTGVVTAALIVLPLIGLVFVLPSFVTNYLAPMQALTGLAPASGPSANLNSTLTTLTSLGL